MEITFLAQYLDELKDLAEHGNQRGEKGDKDIKIKEILDGKANDASGGGSVCSYERPFARARASGGSLRGAQEALANSEDGMIRLAQMLEPAADSIRKKHDEVLVNVEASATAQIAQYRYRLFGDAEYPDATGTARVEFGILKGYTDRAGVDEPYAATFSGLYYRRNNQGPYLVPEKWIAAKATLNAIGAPLDFVSTCDIGGGEAGSANGEPGRRIGWDDFRREY